MFDPEVHEGTSHLVGGINLDVVVEGVETSLRPTPGRLWVRVSTRGARLVVQLVDFRAQHDGRWNEPRQETGTCTGVRVRVKVASASPAAVIGQPLGGPSFSQVEVAVDGDYTAINVPDFDTWTILVIDR